jgi:hypothetical protein
MIDDRAVGWFGEGRREIKIVLTVGKLIYMGTRQRKS